MTPEAAKTITTLETRVRQMLMLVDDLRAENARLHSLLQEREIEAELLKEEIETRKKEYTTLKMARIIDITDKDKVMMRQRINDLLREVDKCINILKN